MTLDTFKLLSFDTAKYPLRETMQEVLKVPDLSRFDSAKPGVKDDQDTPTHKLFYASFDRSVQPLYESLVASMLGRTLADVYVQAVPTLRVHPIGATAVSAWHTDAQFGHQASETNYWLPLTNTFGTNTLWVQDAPIVASYGQVAVFAGAKVIHGNKTNTTGSTRVSLDFRTIPRHDLQETGAVSISSGTPFKLGGYWKALSADVDGA